MADFENYNDDTDLGEDLGSVTLTMDDGSELECDIVAIYPAGGKQYIALLPIDEPEDEAGVLIYRYIDNGDEEDPDIENIEDDDEYDLAADAFDELLDEEDFDLE